MRYPAIFAILALLFFAMPDAHAQRSPLLDYLLTGQQQELAQSVLDAAVAQLRELPPLHQVLLMTTVTILMVSAGVIVSYLINSIAAITGIGLALAALLPLALIALAGLALGRRKASEALFQRLRHHHEFGPFVSRLHTRAWKRRFRRAAAEHGFARQI